MDRPFHDFHTVWCLAHRLNLVTKVFLELKGLNIVKSFSDWFSDSHRQTAYKTFVAQRAGNWRLRSIPHPSYTRWLFYHDVVSAILSQMESVVDLITGHEVFHKLWNSLRSEKLTFGELVEGGFSKMSRSSRSFNSSSSFSICLERQTCISRAIFIDLGCLVYCELNQGTLLPFNYEDSDFSFIIHIHVCL